MMSRWRERAATADRRLNPARAGVTVADSKNAIGGKSRRGRPSLHHVGMVRTGPADPERTALFQRVGACLGLDAVLRPESGEAPGANTD